MRRRDMVRLGAAGIAGAVGVAGASGSALAALAGASAEGGDRRAAARRLPISDPDFALRTWARLQGDLSGRVTYSFLGGMVYGFLPQGDDVRLSDFARRLYGYRSGSARLSRVAGDGTIHVRSRSWFFYTDAESGEYLEELTNPYTGERVHCPPRATPIVDTVLTRNGPRALPASAFSAESSEDDRPFRLDYSVMGEHVWIRHNQYSRFHPGDTTWYKLEADIITCAARLEHVLDGKLTHIDNTTSHNLVAEWQTWMNMHGTPGHILFVGNGGNAFQPDGLPPEFREHIAARFPGTLAEPLRWT